jgi:hypothetical protein
MIMIDQRRQVLARRERMKDQFANGVIKVAIGVLVLCFFVTCLGMAA